MKIVTAGRGNGKTTQAIEWLIAGERAPAPIGWSRAIVCHSAQEAERLVPLVMSKTVGLARYDRFPIFGIPVFSVDEWQRLAGGNQGTQVWVDNLDIILDGLLRARVAAISLTSEEPSPNQPPAGDASWI